MTEQTKVYREPRDPEDCPDRLFARDQEPGDAAKRGDTNPLRYTVFTGDGFKQTFTVEAPAKSDAPAAKLQ